MQKKANATKHQNAKCIAKSHRLGGTHTDSEAGGEVARHLGRGIVRQPLEHYAKRNRQTGYFNTRLD